MRDNHVRLDFFFSICIRVHVCNWFVCLCNFLLPWFYNLDSGIRNNSSGNNRNEIYTFDAFLRDVVMTEERIAELRALCAEYGQKKSACEAAGLKAKAADIAEDGVGRKALEALPELLDELSRLREKAYGAYHRGIEKGRAQCNELRQCDIEAKISQLALELEKERAISKQLVEFMDQDLDACVEHIWNGILRRGRECKDCASCWRTAAEKAIQTHKEKSHD